MKTTQGWSRASSRNRSATTLRAWRNLRATRGDTEVLENQNVLWPSEGIRTIQISIKTQVSGWNVSLNRVIPLGYQVLNNAFAGER